MFFLYLQQQQLKLQTIQISYHQKIFKNMSNYNLIQSKKYLKANEKIQKTAITQTTSKICQNCKLVRQELEAEIFNLKNKAHQSFMQVIQVQQLHEQELQLLKQEYQQESQNSKKQISKLQDALKQSRQQAEIIQKNLKQHTYDLENDSFLVQNIQIIHCHQNQKSYLNDSSLSQFTEFLSNGLNENLHLSSTNANFKQTKNQIIKQLNKSGLQSFAPAVQKKLQKLYGTVSQLQSDVSYLQQRNQHLKRQKEDYQNKYNTIKANYDSLFKQSKFMSDHIRNISSQKLRIQRKLKEVQKQLNSKKVIQSHHPGQSLHIPAHSYNNLQSSQDSYSPTIKININNPNSASNKQKINRSKQSSPLLKSKDSSPYINVKNYDYFVDQESGSINASNNLKQKSLQEVKNNKKVLQKSSTYRRQLTVSKNFQRQEQDKSMMKQIRQGLKLKTLMKKSQNNLEKPIRGSTKKTSLHLPPAPTLSNN